MVLKRELSAILPILSDPANEERTAEEIGEAVILALDEIRAKHNRLAVVVRHRWSRGDDYSLAVLGPYGARAVAEAKRMGEAACISLARPGDGMYALAPAYPSPKAAWDELKPPPGADSLREQVRRDIAAQVPGLWGDDPSPCPTCCCGLPSGNPCLVHPKAAQ